MRGGNERAFGPERKKGKYAHQVGLKDVAFAVDEERAGQLDLAVPFEHVNQAERALRERVVAPTQLFENDGTIHQVVVFDPEPVGYSGFADCVTHSLSLTDQGVFEVGRYPAMHMEKQHRYWQWFLHQRLATTKRHRRWQEDNGLSAHQVVDLFYEVMTGRPKARDEESPFRFPLGRTVQTPGAQRAVEKAGQHPMGFIACHITGDWGELDDFDKRQNEEALQRHLSLRSAYPLSTGRRLWVITEADRSATTLLLPEEY